MTAHPTGTSTGPLAGVRVIEIVAGTSLVGAGLATHLPGVLLGDLGAEVIRTRLGPASTLDAGVEWERVWARNKHLVATDDPARLAEEADIVVLSGPERLIEGQGLGAADLRKANDRLVVARIRPSSDSAGALADHELLVQARTGFLGQVPAPRPGPGFCNLSIAGAGAAFAATAGALACLYEREATGAGGWVETSLYDGLLTLLPMIIGRAERSTPATAMLWEQQGPAANLCQRCADGRYVQLWFGAKGAYEEFLAHLGDEPTTIGYAAELASDVMAARAERWAQRFAGQPQAYWVADMAGKGFRCDPILRPGELLRAEHLRHVGLAIDIEDPERGALTALGPVARSSPASAPAPAARDPRPGSGPARMLSDVRVLDLSAYMAGPVAARVLADLGADVVKVEPPAGDAQRFMDPIFAGAQRGKRSLVLDLKQPGAPEVLDRLFRWADVVHHNSRVGLAERLGYDEATARQANQALVYSHASGFGPTGPWAPLPSNDYVIQALTGMAAGLSTPGQPPVVTAMAVIDVAGGWISACAMIAALYARRRTGAGQQVTSSLIGAGLSLQSGIFFAGDTLVEGPRLDDARTGYGATYRIYAGSDGQWLALVVPDSATWSRLRAALPAGTELPAEPPPLRTGGQSADDSEAILEAVFAARPAAEWIATLSAAGVPVEAVLDADRRAFVARVLDDPVNRQLGRVMRYHYARVGQLDQVTVPFRFGPQGLPAPAGTIPGLGADTRAVLGEAGLDAAQQDKLLAAGTVTAPAR